MQPQAARGHLLESKRPPWRAWHWPQAESCSQPVPSRPSGSAWRACATRGTTRVEMAQQFGAAQPVVWDYKRGEPRLHGQLS